MHITLPLLVRLRACADQRNAFAALFPEGLTVQGEPDAEVIRRIVGADLDVSWLCGEVLTETARVAYLAATATAFDAYNEAEAHAWAAYRAAKATALTAWDAYNETVATALSALNEAKANAAWRLLSAPSNLKPEFR